MLLILDQHLTEFSARLRGVAERKGLKTLLLTSADIASDLALVFCLSDKDVSFQMRYQDITIETRDIEGVYCGIDAFGPELWNRFSPVDAKYAAQETQALWLAILASLPCKVLNPPALDTLAGTMLSTPEILYLAHRLGFQIPMVISVESGKVTTELLAAGIPVLYADLGEVRINEASLSQHDLSSLTQNENHFRVKEEVRGRPVYVTLVGDHFFISTMNAGGSVTSVPASQIPYPVRTCVQTLHKELNLNLAEYYFRIMADDTWVFSGCARQPTFAVAAFGDVLFEQILDYAIGKGE